MLDVGGNVTTGNALETLTLAMFDLAATLQHGGRT
jgi:hypothetical protein